MFQNNFFVKISGIEVVDFLPDQRTPVGFFCFGLIPFVCDLVPSAKHLSRGGIAQIFTDRKADVLVIGSSLIFTCPEHLTEGRKDLVLFRNGSCILIIFYDFIQITCDDCRLLPSDNMFQGIHKSLWFGREAP